jgi:hypothetical protein
MKRALVLAATAAAFLAAIVTAPPGIPVVDVGPAGAIVLDVSDCAVTGGLGFPAALCAVPDDTVDDADAINNAITHVANNGGGTVELDVGRYYITSASVNLKSRVVLAGQGIQPRVGTSAPPNIGGAELYSEAQNTVLNVTAAGDSGIRDIRVHAAKTGQTATTPAAVRVVNSPLVTFERCVVFRGGFAAVEVVDSMEFSFRQCQIGGQGKAYNGLVLAGSPDSRIHDSQIYGDNGHAVWLKPWSSNTMVTNNSIDWGAKHGLFIETGGITVTGNMIRQNAWDGIHVNPNQTNPTQHNPAVTISGNTFYNNGWNLADGSGVRVAQDGDSVAIDGNTFGNSERDSAPGAGNGQAPDCEKWGVRIEGASRYVSVVGNTITRHTLGGVHNGSSQSATNVVASNVVQPPIACPTVGG